MTEANLLECIYCAAPIRNFAAARIVTIHKNRVPACADIEACNARVDVEERRRMGLSAAAEMQRREDFGPNGDATTPGFFK